MLAPRSWGLSLLKIRCHKHLLDDLILVIVLCVPHNLDDFIGRILGLAGASLDLGRIFFLVVILYLYLRGAGTRIGARAGRTLRAIMTEVSLFAEGETLACLHELRSFIRGDLPSSDTIDFHCVRILRLRPEPAATVPCCGSFAPWQSPSPVYRLDWPERADISVDISERHAPNQSM
jgi:hypothetical protein